MGNCPEDVDAELSLELCDVKPAFLCLTCTTVSYEVSLYVDTLSEISLMELELQKNDMHSYS